MVETLPPEVFGRIAHSLGAEREIAKLSLVCKRWSALVHDPMAAALPARYSGVHCHAKEFGRRPTHLHLSAGSTLRLKSLDLSWLMELHLDDAWKVNLEPLGGAAPLLDKLTLKSRLHIFHGDDSYEKFMSGHRVSELEMHIHPIDPFLLAAKRPRPPPPVAPVAPIPSDAIEWESELDLRAKCPRDHFATRVVARMIITNGFETIHHVRGVHRLQTKVVVGRPGDVVTVELDPLNGFAGINGWQIAYYQATSPIKVWSVEDTTRNASPEAWQDLKAEFEFFSDQLMTTETKSKTPSSLHFNLLVTDLEFHGPNLGAAVVHVDYMTNAMPGEQINDFEMFVYRGRAVDADGVVRIPLNANLSRCNVCQIWTDQPDKSKITVVGKTKNIFMFEHGASGAGFA